jgi:predicted enzyme related to lactoylglutathione lyase
MQVQGVTVSVSDLSRSKAFYEGVLGFTPGSYYEPTRWQPYEFDGRAYFAIIEVPGLQREAWADVVNFDVDEIEALWDRVRDKVEVEADLSESPWGSYRFVISEPTRVRRTVQRDSVHSTSLGHGAGNECCCSIQVPFKAEATCSTAFGTFESKVCPSR